MRKLVKQVLQLFKPAPHIAPLTDERETKERYHHWRLRVFYSIFIGYAVFYCTRRSLTFAMPILMTELGFNKTELGILSSVLSITYGISKFAGGMLVDTSNPRYLMAFGLICTGIFNIFFGLSSSLLFFVFFWFLNGWFQGLGAPACTRLLTHWYSQNERGRWWAVWSTSQNVGGAVIPIIVGCCAQYYGWRFAMIFPGLLAILGGVFLINRLCDTPQSVGLPSIEVFRSDFPSNTKKVDERQLTVKEILFTYVLNNPFVWMLGISYFFIYVLRTGVSEWTALYLIESKGYSIVGAASVVFWFEIGGFFGNLVAGYTSDRFFRGGRGQINVLFSLCIGMTVFSFWNVSMNSPFVDSIYLFTMGFFIFGPQMLIGMAAAELSHKNAAATAVGFVGWIAYLGSATAGLPLGKITQEFGWNGFFIALASCAMLSTLFLFPLWSIRTADQKLFGGVEEKATT